MAFGKTKSTRSISRLGRALKRYNAQQVSVARYTKEANNNLPDGFRATQGEWQEVFCEDEPLRFLSCIMQACDDSMDDLPFRIVPIDEEFFAWAKGNGKDVGKDSVNEYAVQMSDERCWELFQKNGWDTCYSVYGISVTVMGQDLIKSGKTRFTLSNETAQKIQDYLNARYGGDGGKFVAMPYVLDAEDFCKEEDNIREFAKIYFETGARIKYINWEDQEYDNEKLNIFRMYIPLGYTYKLTTPSYTVNDLCENEDFFLMVNPNVKELTKEDEIFAEELHPLLIKDFGLTDDTGVAFAIPGIVAPYEVPNIETQFLKSMSSAAQEKGMQVHAVEA